MKIKLVAATVLAGGIAVTGLTGSAFAASGTSAAKTTAPVKTAGAVKAAGTVEAGGVAAGSVTDHGAVAIACVGKGVRIKGKPGKAAFSIKAPGKLPAPREQHFTVSGDARALPAPPPGAKVTKLLTAKGVHGIPKIGPAPKGLHCFHVKPGTPGAPPAVPAR